MPLRIIIDGYNLIRQSLTLRSYDYLDIAKGREKLIEKLAHYRTLKHHPILVVFDGWQEGNPAEQRTEEKGIDIIYSKRGEKADELIKRLVSKSREELIVVTSDREITHFCKSKRCEVIPSPSFEEKMELSSLASMKGLEEDDEKPLPPLSTKKKGPSRRLPKSKRRLLQRLKKL
jgi:predicted RNA-binding protein with PIN domain